jgi:cobalt-zinc-cadmium efflux system membrane fusion protein
MLKLRFCRTGITYVLMNSIGVRFLVGCLATTSQCHSQTHVAAADSTYDAATEVVVLPASKLPLAGIEVATAERRRLNITRTAPGRVRYDDRRHIEVKSAAAGIVREVRVKPGDRVEVGTVLAVVTSAEVGEARADLLSLIAARDIAAKNFRRSRAINEGIAKLVNEIETRADPRKVASHVDAIQLGRYRDTILSAYAAYHLADALYRSAEQNGADGALSGRQIHQRRREFVAAQSALKSAVEQAVIDAEMSQAEAENHVADAERRVAIGTQYVAALQGAHVPLDEAAKADALTELRLLAPISGTVESRRYAVSERVAPGDSLFTLADTTQLWVEAGIREAEWGALQLESGHIISVIAPTLGSKPIPAEIHYVGREVSVETNAVPIVATIANPQGVLRPGQFVEVRVPIADPRTALAVPESAVVEHEGQPFVFVKETPTRFRRVNIQSGVSSEGWVEVKKGLPIGSQVVTKGAFDLKSELLLDRSEE